MVTLKVRTQKATCGCNKSWGKSLCVYWSGAKLHETLQRQIALRLYWRIFGEISVSATEFFCRHKSHKFSLIWFCVTCCKTKFCCRDKTSHENSPVHTKQFVAAMCHCNLLPSVFQPLLACSRSILSVVGWFYLLDFFVVVDHNSSS